MSQVFDIDAQEAALKRQAELALEHARQHGATACELSAAVSQGLEVDVRFGEVETLELARDQGFGITVYVGQRKGNASTSDASERSIRETVEKAIDIARFTGEDTHAGLADIERMATDFPDLEVHHPWALDPDEAADLAARCERAGLAVEGISNSEGAHLSTGEGVTLYANSHGFMGTQRGSRHSLSCVLIARDDAGMQRDMDYSSTRHPFLLRSPEDIGHRAAERTLARLGALKAPSGTMPVVFAPSMAKGLIGHFLSAIAGGALYRESSFLCDRLGESLFPEWFSLGERPRIKGAMSSAAFDGEGVATQDNDFVKQGRLSSYMLSSYSARRLGLESTGNAGGARNVRIDAPLTDYNALIGGIEHGVIVTELMGQGINTVTGDYSRGASGFLIKNGAIAGPIEEFTVAGNLSGMFASLAGLGDDLDTRGSIHTGSWRVDGMTVTG
ncbi:metalloprotease PmbA [Larsenimonas suaedae]|uniref:Metalloprotease PmbA n=1 Tax=Larsenimonas suaedae TaxID=1851019 RepID=A0ABU1GUK4_9GAMM|nr:metalloprotease PmbA [Larsenimonas suaedae]MCM2970997.1 metalloprotease PmbA [Larsenimonas suaedae]MDR5895706.1 metalloprotease PmbA [Larsenimonas suaedae]